mmetsp:Transcript_7459/g.24331  ORF Transcript_7459/g.24331 Transcript_7459/m.24331 type:complete len:197 (-) Transcript_7459:49-639(-)
MAKLFEELAGWRDAQTSLPRLHAVGAKIRLGANQREQDFKVYLPVAEAAVEHGLDFLTVHARHGEQRSRDAPTWAALAEVSEVARGSRLSVIGNGDVKTACDAQRMRAETGVDAVMVGRAAMHNPWSLRSLSQPDGHLELATERWPSLAELDSAQQAWDALGATHLGRQRYRPFHADNFRRIREESRLREAKRGGL